MAGDIRIGISGWRYAPWRGVFYPKGLVQRLELDYASRQFPTIEINGSFYALQTPERYANWYAATPPGFMFSVKAPRYMTHILRLREVDAPLARFLDSGVFELKEKLGPILWQFPPSMRFEPDRFEAFLRALPREHDGRPMRHAVEIRNDSFVDPAFAQMLRHHGAALVVADSARQWPDQEDVTADFVYMRLHGKDEMYASGYDDKALEHWRARIQAWAGGGEPQGAHRMDGKAPRARARDVFCYFDNDAKVQAPRNAKELMRKLGLPLQAEPPAG